jgi:alcohol dehydrogenase (cytochrome c)
VDLSGGKFSHATTDAQLQTVISNGFPTVAVLAIDPNSGDVKWRYPMTDVTDTGIVTTASDLLITGGREGYLQVLDARTGVLLWKASLGAQMASNPITYAVNGKQYVAAIAGLTLVTFALSN